MWKRILSWFRRRPPEPPEHTLPRRLRELEIVTARLIRAGFAGQYHAAFHGKGIEFAQVREYQPGDDIRTIDWNVTARSGVPHVKQFVEERDLTVLIAIDLSRSMEFGSLDRRKIDLAVELTAVLSFAALHNNDRVGLLLFGSDVRTFLPPRRGRVHVETIVRSALLSAGFLESTARFDRASEFLGRVLIQRAVVLLISDFLEFDAEHSVRSLARRHDLVAIGLRDPREERFPSTGLLRLVDHETGAPVDVDLRRTRVDPDRGIGDRLERLGIDYLGLSTAVPYEQALLRFFGQRHRGGAEIYRHATRARMAGAARPR